MWFAFLTPGDGSICITLTIMDAIIGLIYGEWLVW